MSSIDLLYRPAGYFWPMSLAYHLLGTVKGAARQNHIHALIAEDRLEELEGWAAVESLPEPRRRELGRIHPMLMGGEYLPDLRKNEVEIARISLMSVTGDVTSIRATRGKSRIRYRVVDEYGDERRDGLRGRIQDLANRTSTRPLTLGELEQFIEAAGAGMDYIRLNLSSGTDPESLLGFLTATSPYYPDLTKLYDQRFDELIAAGWSVQDDEEEEDSSCTA